MGSLDGRRALIFLRMTPPSLRLRVASVEGVDRDAVDAVELAMRNAVFYLYGHRTGPGYTLSLQPVRPVKEGDLVWIETRVQVIPKDIDRVSLALDIGKAMIRARDALVKMGAGVESPDEVAST